MTDLRAKIKNKVNKGLDKLGTVQRAITYSAMSASAYDEATGTWTNTVLSTDNISVVFSEFVPTRSFSTDILNDEEPIRTIDRLVIFSSLLMTVVPSVNDVIEDLETHVFWRVLGVSGDPADAHYELHVRPFDNV